MAIEVDKMAYSENCNDELLYEYIYHLGYMLAVKNRYFTSGKLYDEFAIFLANSCFMRLKNKKQFEVDKDGKYKLTKIKSILNYIKSIIHFRKISFEQENYCQTILYNDSLDEEVVSKYTLSNRLSSIAESLHRVEFECDLENIINSFKAYLKKLPYRYKSVEWYNIYISCLLTFLNSITLSKKVIKNINSMKHKVNDIDTISEYFKSDDVVLYHVDENMKDYILMLVRIIKHIIAKDLTECLDSAVVNYYNFSDIIIFNELNGNNTYFE